MTRVFPTRGRNMSEKVKTGYIFLIKRVCLFLPQSKTIQNKYFSMSFQEYPLDFGALNEWHAQRLLLLMKNTDSSRKNLEEYKAEAEEMLQQYCPTPTESRSPSSSKRSRRRREKRRIKGSRGLRKQPRKVSYPSQQIYKRNVNYSKNQIHITNQDSLKDTTGSMTIVSRSSTLSSGDEYNEFNEEMEPELAIYNEQKTTKSSGPAMHSLQFELPNDLFLTQELRGTSLCSSPSPSVSNGDETNQMETLNRQPFLYVWENP